jgi:transmembrane sensor
VEEQRKIEDLFAKFVDKKCTPDELQMLLGYMNNEANAPIMDQIMESLWNHVLESYPEIQKEMDKEWLYLEAERLIEITRGPKPKEKKEPNRIISVGRFLKVAAILFVVLCSSFFVVYLMTKNSHDKNIYAETSTKAGEKSSVSLPDGTVISLNSASNIKVPEKFGKATREIALDGEAFFKVTHDSIHPFVTHAGPFLIKVLGTSFNVKAFKDDDEAEVTVTTGKVKVTFELAAQTHEVLLLPSDQLVINKKTGTYHMVKVNAEIISGWKEGKLTFDHTPVRQMMKVLERWYDIKVVAENTAILDCQVSGEHWNENLNSVAEALKFTLGINYKLRNDTLFLFGKGCK